MTLVLIAAGGAAGAIARGRAARLHTSRILRLSDDLPILIEVVDREDRLRAVLPDIDALVGEVLITLEHVDVIAYRSPEYRAPEEDPA